MEHPSKKLKWSNKTRWPYRLRGRRGNRREGFSDASLEREPDVAQRDVWGWFDSHSCAQALITGWAPAGSPTTTEGAGEKAWWW